MNDYDQLLSKVFRRIDSHIKDNGNGNNPVVRYLEPESLRRKIDISIPEKGVSSDKLLEYIDLYLKYSANTANKQFFNQLYAGFNLPAFLGEIIAALTNTSMYTYEVAPVATLIEKELIDKMTRLVGYENGEGTFLTGGSNANLIAMFCARNRAFPEIKKKGSRSLDPMSVFVSEESHYSFDTGANLLGIGTDHVYKIEVDNDGRMIPEKLEEAVQKSITRGEQPLFVCATAGTTLLGAYDPIEKIAPIAQKFGMWLHVDGAFGGSTVLSRENRHLLQGIEQADSFTWNPHKLMNVPLICSALLVKEKGRLLTNLTELNTDYLFHENETQSYDLGKSSIQCGRRVDALKLWLAWKSYGDRGYAERIDKLFFLARYAAEKIEADPDLELVARPQSFAVCFRYRNRDGADINDFNLTLREKLMKSGKSLINYGYWKGNVTIRFVAANPNLDVEDVDQLFGNISEVATETLN